MKISNMKVEGDLAKLINQRRKKNVMTEPKPIVSKEIKEMELTQDAINLNYSERNTPTLNLYIDRNDNDFPKVQFYISSALEKFLIDKAQLNVNIPGIGFNDKMGIIGFILPKKETRKKYKDLVKTTSQQFSKDESSKIIKKLDEFNMYNRSYRYKVNFIPEENIFYIKLGFNNTVNN